MKKINIVFVNPCPKAGGINEATIEPPMGLAYMSAVLENNKFTCSILDANVLRLDIHQTIKEIVKKRPDIVGISANIITASAANQIAKRIKEQLPSLLVIVGGPYPTSSPLECLQESQVDMVVIGEGEETMLDIAEKWRNNKKNINEVSGIAYLKKNKVYFTPKRQLISDINKLPLPAYHLLPNLNLYKTRARAKPVASIFTSRGCPFQCVYCSSNIFGKKYRMRSSQNVLIEIDYLVKNFKVKQIDILDDNFTLDQKRTAEILDGIILRKYHLAINLQSGVRADKVDLNLIRKMKEAGVFKIPFGVETGDKKILKRIKKNLDLKAVIKATQWAKQEGLTTYGFFMFGLPGDNAKSMQKTIDFAIKMDPDIAHFGITIPFPGTELYKETDKQGSFLIPILNGLNLGFESGKVFYLLPGMDQKQIIKFYKKAYRDFYFRPVKMIKTIMSIKSLYELKWIIQASISMISNLILKF